MGRWVGGGNVDDSQVFYLDSYLGLILVGGGDVGGGGVGVGGVWVIINFQGVLTKLNLLTKFYKKTSEKSYIFLHFSVVPGEGQT